MITPNSTASVMRRAAGVPEDGLLDHAEADRGAERDGQVLHPADDGGRERAQQQRRSEDRPDRARRRSARAATRPRPDRPAASTQTIVLIRVTGMPSSHARSDDSAAPRTATPTRLNRKKAPRPTAMIGTTIIASDVVAAEHDRVPVEAEVERRREVLRSEVEPERRGQRELDAAEDLRDADRRDGQDEPRRLRESADEHELDDRADDERRGEPGDERRRRTASPACAISETPSTAATAPRSPCEKLMKRFAR